MKLILPISRFSRIGRSPKAAHGLGDPSQRVRFLSRYAQS